MRPPVAASELLAHGQHRLDRGVAERMHVGGLENELLLREGGHAEFGRKRAERAWRRRGGAQFGGSWSSSVIVCSCLQAPHRRIS